MQRKSKTAKLIIIIMIITALLSSCSGNNQGSSNNNYQEASLSNPNANEVTKNIYSYLCDLYGKGSLGAQQESIWMNSPEYEMDYIYGASGKYPAIRGLDYMNDDFDGVNGRACEWWNRGGLVTICWHTGSDFSGEWKDAMNDIITDWDAAVTNGTPENKQLIDGMDKAAQALSELQDKGVTVIWRPFHEFDGQWFWWGKGGADNFIKLWQMMYDRYTDYWHLNNLIWVLGYSHIGKEYDNWYPGDEYCDIVGADSYDGGAQPELYEKIMKINKSNKPMCFHECGANPNANELRETPWIWFMTWHTEYLIDNNDEKSLNELYNSDYVITLDELPVFN